MESVTTILELGEELRWDILKLSSGSATLMGARGYLGLGGPEQLTTKKTAASGSMATEILQFCLLPPTV
jgi:hypothetical protein